MLNCFENPWLLIGISFILLVTVYMIRTSFPEKARFWHLLIPVFGIAAAFAVDHLVITDNEKIHNLFSTAITAVKAQNPDALEPLFAEDYTDRFHRSKQALMKTCRNRLTSRSFHKIKRTHALTNIEGNKAKTELTIRIQSNKGTNTESLTPEFMFARIWLTLSKHPNGTWAIRSTDKLEINNTPINWK